MKLILFGKTICAENDENTQTERSILLRSFNRRPQSSSLRDTNMAELVNPEERFIDINERIPSLNQNSISYKVMDTANNNNM